MSLGSAGFAAAMSASGAAVELEAVCGGAIDDPDLLAVVAARATLPVAIRDGVTAMVKAVQSRASEQ